MTTRRDVHRDALNVIARLMKGATLSWYWMERPLTKPTPRYVIRGPGDRAPMTVPRGVIYELKRRGIIEAGDITGEVRLRRPDDELVETRA